MLLVALLVAAIVIATIARSPIEAMLLVLAVWAFAGFHGNDWRRSKLSRRGFTYAGTYQADTPDAALAIVIHKRQNGTKNA